MRAVRDHSEHGLVAGQQCADEPRLTVMQRGHAVKEVGRHSGACVYGFLSRRGVSAGVAEAHCYSVACELLDRGQAAGLLRRQRDDGRCTGCEPLLGVTALESVGIAVDPGKKTLRRLPAIPLK